MAVSSIGGIDSTATVGGHPLHPMLVPFPIAFLVATLACDLAFWASGNPFWANVALWALGAGVATGALAAVAGLADFLGDIRIRALRDAWRHMLGNALLLVLAFSNLYIRGSARVLEQAVLPWGILLSATVVGLMIYTAWKGGALVYRHRVGAGPAKAEAPRPDAFDTAARARPA